MPITLKVVDPGVLQEPVHDAGDPYVLGDPGYSGSEAAESPDVEVDLHSSVGCLI